MRLALTQILANLILKLFPNDSGFRYPIGMLLMVVIEKKERVFGNRPAIISEDSPQPNL
jgi:hypothetical protein